MTRRVARGSNIKWRAFERAYHIDAASECAEFCLFVILSGAQRSRRISNYLSAARLQPVVHWSRKRCRKTARVVLE